MVIIYVILVASFYFVPEDAAEEVAANVTEHAVRLRHVIMPR
jgi:hypothetical protein